MIDPTGIRRAAPFALGLALWTALPGIEWCSITWEQCRAHCATAAASGHGAAPIACEAAPGAASCRTAERAEAAVRGLGIACTPAVTACAATNDGCARPCDPASGPAPPGDRAWCIHPPVNALLVRQLELPSPASAPLLAIQEAYLDPQSRTRTAVRLEPDRLRSPVLAAPHAPPLARAPPLA